MGRGKRLKRWTRGGGGVVVEGEEVVEVEEMDKGGGNSRLDGRWVKSYFHTYITYSPSLSRWQYIVWSVV